MPGACALLRLGRTRAEYFSALVRLLSRGEHMIFLGSKKYPGEADFEEFLSENGGDSNAYTECEYTCFLASTFTVGLEPDKYDLCPAGPEVSTFR